MPYGLDIGSGAITRVADGDEPARSEPPVAFPVAESALESAGLSLADTLTVDVADATYVVGLDANTAADAAGDVPHELFENGALVDEAYAGSALEAIVDTVVPEQADERGCFTTPGTVIDTPETSEPYQAVAESIRVARGLEPAPIARGFAVVYDQLATDNYTGLGVCIGRQTTSVALAYYGVPAMAFSVAKGGEWLVERAAADAADSPERVTAVLEGFELDPNAATGEIESALAGAYDALVAEIADAIRAEANEGELQQGLAVPIAIGGERAVEGVEYLFGGRFDAANLPFSVRGVRLAEEPAASPARGALAAAQDGVTDDDGIVVDESAVGADASNAADGASETDADNNGTTLSFDESLEPEREAERADAAIDQLFDRLANRDEQIQSVSADLEDLADTVEAIEERSAAAADLQELETAADDLAALEAESETYASDVAVDTLEASVDDLSNDLAAIEDSVAALDGALAELADTATSERADLGDDIAALETDLESLKHEVTDLEDEVSNSTAFDSLAADLETAEDGVGALESDVQSLETRLERQLDETSTELENALAETRANVDDNFESLEDNRESLSNLREELERGTAEAANADAVAELRETVSTVRESTDALDATADELAADLEAVELRLEESESELSGRADALESTLDERTSEHANRLDEQEQRVDAVAAEVDELATDLETASDESAAGRTADLQNEIDGLRTELESVRAESTGTAGVVPVVAAGGGGAGLVAGGTVAFTGAMTVGAVAAVVGALLLTAAVLLGR